MIQIPETYDQMRRLPYAVRRELWARYSPHPFVRQNMALWYYIQCDRLKLVPQGHILPYKGMWRIPRCGTIFNAID